MTNPSPEFSRPPDRDPAATAESDRAVPADRGLKLRSAEFRKGREPGWRELDELVNRAERRGIASLSADEAQRLPLLYRSAMSSLAVARAVALDRNLLLYLENLALRAYLTVYGPRTGVLENLEEFFRRGFPRSVRALRRHMALVFGALLVGVAAGYLLVRADLNNFHLLVPEYLAGGRGPGSSRADLLEGELFAPWPGFLHTFVVFANALFRHNALVGLLSFGLGFAFGVPTLILFVSNGLTLGAFVALHAAHGLTVDFLGWLAVHGVTEILALVLCGAAGLAVAEKILFPGPLTRLESLAVHGRRAAGVAAGAVGLFFVAGVLEGGFRQWIDNTPGRFAFALVTALAWLAYFGLSGRERGHGRHP